MAEVYKIIDSWVAAVVYEGPGSSYKEVGIIYGKDNERYTVLERKNKYWLKLNENQWVRDRDYTGVMIMKKVSTASSIIVPVEDLEKEPTNPGDKPDLPDIPGDIKGEIGLASPDVDGLMSKEDKTKLDTIEANANNYVHPYTHEANMIVEDNMHRFVTDEQISNWNGNVTETATEEANGLMSKEDKVKLDSIEEGANNYAHPENHVASMIVEDVTHRFVTDAEKSKWNNKADSVLATSELDGLLAKTDKAKIDLIPENAVYTDTTYELATSEIDGLLAAEDKAKIDLIPENAVYTDTTYELATEELDGLMSKEDKSRLDKLPNFVNAPYYDETEGCLYGNGIPITIEASTEANKLTVKWVSNRGHETMEIPDGRVIYGGGYGEDKPVYYPATCITINSGFIKNVFGGSRRGSVGNSTIIVNGGTFATGQGVQAGGSGYSNSTKHTLDNIVGHGEIIINKTDNTITVVYGGGQGDSVVGSTNITINGGSINYLTAGGSNGYTGSGSVTVNGGNIQVLQGCNRGAMGVIDLTVNDGTIKSLYAGGETEDSSVNATYIKSKVNINGGTINKISAGTNGGLESSDNVSGSYVQNIISDEAAASMNLTKINKIENLSMVLEDTMLVLKNGDTEISSIDLANLFA